ncbi:MAG: glycine cleavage system protein GcvH [Candidatus Riflemargulisbacteria bacterium]
MIIKGLYYSEEHEWVKVNGSVATIGITDYAQDALGDIVFVELPNVDDEFTQMDEIGVLESVKTVSNIYIPVSGRIVEVNESVIEDPALVNSSPYDEGWLVKVEMYEKAELDDLNSAEDYEESLGEEE